MRCFQSSNHGGDAAVALENFFQLPGSPPDVDEQAFLALARAEGTIRSKIYRPNSLKSPNSPQHLRIRNCKFIEISFSKTVVEDIEFKDCTFTSCLFVGTVFKNCRFNDCVFLDCNTYRIEFVDVYLNPRSFSQCLDKKRHQNIGVHLYQELLNNSRRQSQPDFAQDSLFEFRRWLRFEHIYMLIQKKFENVGQIELVGRIVESWLLEKLLGFGVRLRNYIGTAVLVALTLTIINNTWASELGLKLSEDSFVDSLYFTVITLTTIGYGDITPTTTLGKLIVSGEGITGFVLFATLASMVYRKILP
jgi:hypothetical protein